MPSVWPLTLPTGPLLDGYDDAAPNNLLRTATEGGVARVRVKGENFPWPMSATFRMTRAQTFIFEEFIEVTLQSGALRFEFYHPRLQQTVEVRILPISSTKKYQFVPDGSGSWWRLTLSLEVMP